MLEIDALEAAYGRARVLFGVSLEVPEGALVCVLGRNGAGKTTLLDAVMGLLPPSAGHVRLRGRDVTRSGPHRLVRAGMGYVPQGHATFPQLTVWENLTVVGEAGGRAARAAATEEALEFFPRLRPLLQRRAGVLSGGQQQQLAIARALVNRPEILLLDEPAEGIQPSIVAEIEDVIHRLHQERGLTVVLVEQHLDLATRLADRFVILEGGEVATTGDHADLGAEQVRTLLAV